VDAAPADAGQRGICNLGMALTVDHKLRWWPLQETLNHLLRRHRALRGTLRMHGSVPRKFFLPEDTEFPLATVAPGSPGSTAGCPSAGSPRPPEAAGRGRGETDGRRPVNRRRSQRAVV
jgi:hypothetical protein